MDAKVLVSMADTSSQSACCSMKLHHRLHPPPHPPPPPPPKMPGGGHGADGGVGECGAQAASAVAGTSPRLLLSNKARLMLP